MKNKYYRVIDEINCTIKVGDKRSNVHYGSVNFYEPILRPFVLAKGDIITNIGDCVWFVETNLIETKISQLWNEPPEFTPLEKKTNQGNEFNAFPIEDLEEWEPLNGLAKEFSDQFKDLDFYWTDSGEEHWEMFQYDEDEGSWLEVRILLDRVEWVYCLHNETNWKATDEQVLFESDSIDEVLSIIKSNEKEF